MGLSGLKCTKIGAWVKAVLRVSNTFVWSEPQANGVSLGVRQIGYDNVREPHNELVIEVGETQECLDCLEVNWGQPDTDHISLGGVHRYASGGNHKTQELNILRVEQTLLGFGVQVIFMKTFQDMSAMDLMIFQ